MTSYADMVVLGKDQRVVAVVEVKGPRDLTAERAAEIRRNLLAHSAPEGAAYFLVASNQKGFLWEPSQGNDLAAPPSLVFDMRPVFSRYAEVTGHTEPLRGAQLELVVYEWLSRLANSSPAELDESAAQLGSSGFLEAVQGGSVVAEVVR